MADEHGPPKVTRCTLSYPAPWVLLVILVGSSELNRMPRLANWELEAVWQWMDRNPALRVGIITGSEKAFCTGADFHEWMNTPKDQQGLLPPSGFCGLSMRHGVKPVLAAVKGLAVGGGLETLVNCDMVLCSPSARFSFPDVKVGLTLLGGTLPMLVRKIGRSRATDMVLTGRMVGAKEAESWGLVDRVTEDPVKDAIDIAKSISANSPDAVWASREGIYLGLTDMDTFDAGRLFLQKILGGVSEEQRRRQRRNECFS